jgi:hypothetical protein
VNVHIETIAAINERAREVLIREIGIVNTIRFLNQFQRGFGNYTKEREQLFEGMSVRDIINDNKAQRGGV